MFWEIMARHMYNFYPQDNTPDAEHARIKTRAALIWTFVIVIGCIILARLCTC